MKRKNEKVPEFDEIIFQNRNKTYGAYYLRKHYKSAASLSIFGGIAISIILITALSLNTQKGTAITPPTVVSLVVTAPIIQKVETPPEKMPARLKNVTQNLKPEVTEDSSEATAFIPTAEQILISTSNGSPSDTGTIALQTDPVVPVEPEPAIRVEEMPEFPGGISALMKFIGDNIKYPPEAQKNYIQGKVFLKFVVTADGSTDRIEVSRGVDSLLDNEAVRVVKSLPKFRPGKQGGIPVPVWYTLPVNFRIEEN